ncbi:MAG: helix-turn-helix domain-containing protein [Candidatus Cryptobacteroides sp.]
MSIFGTRLHIARNIAGLSLQELSVAIGGAVSKQSLSMYECGIMKPRPRVLSAISQTLGVSIEYFSMENERINLPLLRTCFPHTLSQEDFLKLESTILFHTERFRQKLDSLHVTGSFNCSLLNLPITGIDDASVLADKLREEWACGDGAIPSILRLLERRGIWVFDSVLPDGVLGVSTWVDEAFPVMILDSRTEKTSVERLRFTAAHELAHLLFEVPEGMDAERMCNLFASYFLLPKKTLIQELGSKRDALYLEELIDLHEYYGVSVAALVHEAFDFAIISRTHYDYWFDTLINANKKEKGWGEYRFPESLGREKRMDIILTHSNVKS